MAIRKGRFTDCQNYADSLMHAVLAHGELVPDAKAITDERYYVKKAPSKIITT